MMLLMMSMMAENQCGIARHLSGALSGLS